MITVVREEFVESDPLETAIAWIELVNEYNSSVQMQGQGVRSIPLATEVVLLGQEQVELRVVPESMWNSHFDTELTGREKRCLADEETLLLAHSQKLDGWKTDLPKNHAVEAPQQDLLSPVVEFDLAVK